MVLEARVAVPFGRGEREMVLVELDRGVGDICLEIDNKSAKIYRMVR